jgi:hypothetical protein
MFIGCVACVLLANLYENSAARALPIAKVDAPSAAVPAANARRDSIVISLSSPYLYFDVTIVAGGRACQCEGAKFVADDSRSAFRTQRPVQATSIEKPVARSMQHSQN